MLWQRRLQRHPPGAGAADAEPRSQSCCAALSAGDRAEGAENKASDRASRSRSGRSGSAEGLALEGRMKQLSLQCMKIKEGICAGRKAAQIG